MLQNNMSILKFQDFYWIITKIIIRILSTSYKTLITINYHKQKGNKKYIYKNGNHV